jgi:hypothetical protein
MGVEAPVAQVAEAKRAGGRGLRFEACNRIGNVLDVTERWTKSKKLGQRVDRPRIKNPRVGGSIPPLGTIYSQ